MLRDELDYLVEYLRFHLAESGDWDTLLPEHDLALSGAEAILKQLIVVP